MASCLGFAATIVIYVVLLLGFVVAGADLPEVSSINLTCPGLDPFAPALDLGSPSTSPPLPAFASDADLETAVLWVLPLVGCFAFLFFFVMSLGC
jgi:hypothetical protein